MMHTVYLSLGTNLGDKEQNLQTAIAEIARRIGPVQAQSAFIETEPWGFESLNSFLNAAVRVETELSPFALLHKTQLIEQDMGRTEKTTPLLLTANERSALPAYHDRIIDIDILLYDDLHLSTPQLTIPHPLMNERDFVLIPLKEIRT